MTVTNNKSPGYFGAGSGTGTAIIHVTANATIVVAGNNSVSNVAVGSEIVSSATVRKVWHGVADANTYWTVKRGANTLLVLNNSGHIDLTTGGVLGIDAAANLVFEKTGSGTGFICVEIKKQ